eukprot:5879907-Amphidinium_carterae.2
MVAARLFESLACSYATADIRFDTLDANPYPWLGTPAYYPTKKGLEEKGASIPWDVPDLCPTDFADRPGLVVSLLPAVERYPAYLFTCLTHIPYRREPPPLPGAEFRSTLVQWAGPDVLDIGGQETACVHLPMIGTWQGTEARPQNVIGGSQRWASEWLKICVLP